MDKVTGKKCNELKYSKAKSTAYFTHSKNSFNNLSLQSDTSEPKPPQALATSSTKTKVKPKSPRRRHVQHILRQFAQQGKCLPCHSIARAKQEHTEMAKRDPNNPARRTIEAHEAQNKNKPSLIQTGRNISYNISSFLSRAAISLNQHTKRVQLPTHAQFKSSNKQTSQ